MAQREFIEWAKGLAKGMSREELMDFFLFLAGKVPEEKRAAFRAAAEEYARYTAGSGSAGERRAALDAREAEAILREKERLKGLFERIRKEELRMKASRGEEYGWDGDWEWEYSDYEEACQAFEDGCSFVRQCADKGHFREGAEIFSELLERKVYVENDWGDFSMGLKELDEEGFISAELKRVFLDGLETVYQSEGGKERADRVYGCLFAQPCREVNLHDLAERAGGEPAEWDGFLDSFIRLLGEKKGDRALGLLREAVSMKGFRAGELARLARPMAAVHPAIYLDAMEAFEEKGDWEAMYQTGQEALKETDPDLRIREALALAAAGAAEELGLSKEAEALRLEAFSSNRTPVNFLRAAVESENSRGTKARAMEILFEKKEKPEVYRDFRMERAWELWRGDTYGKGVIKFLAGDIDGAMEDGAKAAQARGCLDGFAENMAPLLLFFLKSKELGPGCQALVRVACREIGFRAAEYVKGTRDWRLAKKEGLSDEEVFWDCFQKWREDWPMDAEKAGEYIEKLEKLLDGQIRAIVSGQNRALYHEAAAFAAALGEVKESQGEAEGKVRVMERYKAMFPRHTAFKREMKGFWG